MEEQGEKIGKVWLVGAGPGDPGLLTVRAFEALESADVVIYDRLVGTGILSRIPPDTQLIDVGKGDAFHPVPQEDINRLIAEHALAGRCVARLKGGDPFLFGRGGEELVYLRERGIAAEVVPGVSSALAVPAYAGIPVTFRGLSASVHVLTWHRRAGEPPPALPFRALVDGGGTLVILMGAKAVLAISRTLLDVGVAADTPAAIIQNGTTARQATVLSTVGGLPEDASGMAPPAVIVIGAVAALAPRLDWFSSGPLRGRRIVVTRPSAQAGDICARIRAFGGEAVPVPCIRRQAADDGALRDALNRLARYRWLAFTSAAGVDAFFEALYKAGTDIRALGGTLFAAVGKATAARLAGYGVHADCVPDAHNGDALGRALSERVQPGERVLLLRAAQGDAGLPAALNAAGIAFDDVPAYKTVADVGGNRFSHALIEAGAFDAVYFASPSAVHAFAGAFKAPEGAPFTAFCIGPTTAAAAKKYGMSVLTASDATEDSVITALLDHIKKDGNTWN